MKSTQEMLKDRQGSVVHASSMAGKSSAGTGESSTQSRARAARLVMALLDNLRTACDDPTVGAHTLSMLMLIAQNPKGVAIVDLAQCLGTSSATAYRSHEILGKGTKDGKVKGLGLTVGEPDATSRNRILLTLSERGEAVVRDMEAKLLASLKGLA